jgi:phospholipid/cholesterol/gamma-HCH transport system ATP-binding protein
MLFRRCGVLFQSSALFSSLTVRENVQVPLREAKLPDELCEAITSLKIGLAGLPPDIADLYPAQLSGGMQKRVALARAIALDPELLLLDEPTAGLDPPTAAGLDQLLFDLSRALGLTMILVTHDLGSLNAISDRVAVLVGGRIIATGPIAKIEALDHPWIRAYFHGPRTRHLADIRRPERPSLGAASLDLR